MAPLTNKELAKQLREIADVGIVNYKQNGILRQAADRLEKPGHRRDRKKSTVLYTVWDNRTDKCIAFDLSGKECAERMGIEYNSFMVAIARGSDRWTIEKRFVDAVNH